MRPFSAVRYSTLNGGSLKGQLTQNQCNGIIRIYFYCPMCYTLLLYDGKRRIGGDGRKEEEEVLVIGRHGGQ